MSAQSPLLLIGIGTAGSQIARGVSRAFGEGLRYVLADTDAASGSDDGHFILLGGDRLSGHGSGGDVPVARLAAEDSAANFDPFLEDVRLAVIVTALGGGTGGGATFETVRHLTSCGVPTVVFATTPFSFEGEDRKRNARGIQSMIEDAANATVFLPLDKLVAGEDNMNVAMKRAVDTVSSGVTLFWRLLEKPGYLKMDADRIRHLLSCAGRGRFATVTTQGPTRAGDAVDALTRSELLASSQTTVRAILCGVLAGDDLRLSELGRIAGGVRSAFGEALPFELGTVNDEATFSGRLSVVLLLFEANGRDDEGAVPAATGGGNRRQRRGKANPLVVGPSGRGRFTNAEPTIWQGEDLDVPTYVRHNITLDF